ncbi:MAG: DinB family protein [Planctomycetota bacterium]
MSDLILNILMLWERNGDYGLALTDQVGAEQSVYQPAGELNHPAWVLSHLNTYHETLEAIIHGHAVTDPKDAAFGMRSQPVADVKAYVSLPRLRDEFLWGHRSIADALRLAGPALLERQVPLERWQNWLPTMSAVLMNLMVWHETLHLGQLSAWRRAAGLPPVSILPIPNQP